MLNQIVLVGRTTRDMALKISTTGRPFGTVTVAVTRAFKNQETNTYDTDFIDVSVWGITAVNVAKYAGKGSAISIRGRVATRILDFPGEKTMKSIGIIAQQVSFIHTKPPSETEQLEKEIREIATDELILEDFPTGEDFNEALENADEQ